MHEGKCTDANTTKGSIVENDKSNQNQGQKENALQYVHCKVKLAEHNSTTTMLQHLNCKH